MKNIFLILALLLVINPLFAQDGYYVDGLVITNEGDSLHGSILSSSCYSQMEKCIFKQDSATEIVEYNPGDIKGYILDNGKYIVSKSFIIDNIEQRLFIEFLVDGQAKLYSYNDLNENLYFLIEREDGEIISLDNTENPVTTDPPKPCIGQLNYIYRDAPQLRNKVNRTRYNKESMIQTAVNYHKEVSKTKDFNVYQEKIVKKNSL